MKTASFVIVNNREETAKAVMAAYAINRDSSVNILCKQVVAFTRPMIGPKTVLANVGKADNRPKNCKRVNRFHIKLNHVVT